VPYGSQQPPNRPATATHRSRPAQQEKAVQCSRRYAKGWREDVLGEAWQQGTATHGAPGGDGVTIEERVAQGQAAARRGRLAAPLRAKT
jgi:hypothetical protein